MLSLYGHSKGVTCLALGEEVIVSGSCDQSVRVWGREEGEQMVSIERHQDIVTGVTQNILTSLIFFISSGIKWFMNTIITTGLDRMILFFSVQHPDITEDFDSGLKVDLQYQFNRKVPEDKSFVAPSNYIQPFQTYAKLTSCLDYDGKFLISAEKRLIYVWSVKDQTQTPHCLSGPQLHKSLGVSSSCDKTVRVWCLGHIF